jgi:hypothetical protein
MFHEDWTAPSGNIATEITYKCFGGSCVVTCTWERQATPADMTALVTHLTGSEAPVRMRQFAEEDHRLTPEEIEQIALGLVYDRSGRDEIV